LPKLNIVAVDKLPGGLDGCGIIRTVQIDRFDEMAVPANNVSSIVGHITLANQARARELSVTGKYPDQNGDLRALLLRAAFVCPVPDSEIELGTKGGVPSLPVPEDAIDPISSLFDGHRSADPRDTRFAFAFAQIEFPSPATSFSQLNNRVFHSLVFHQNSSADQRSGHTPKGRRGMSTCVLNDRILWEDGFGSVGPLIPGIPREA
jgi:hypothetical protein